MIEPRQLYSGMDHSPGGSDNGVCMSGHVCIECDFGMMEPTSGQLLQVSSTAHLPSPQGTSQSSRQSSWHPIATLLLMRHSQGQRVR